MGPCHLTKAFKIKFLNHHKTCPNTSKIIKPRLKKLNLKASVGCGNASLKDHLEKNATFGVVHFAANIQSSH